MTTQQLEGKTVEETLTILLDKAYELAFKRYCDEPKGGKEEVRWRWIAAYTARANELVNQAEVEED